MSFKIEPDKKKHFWVGLPLGMFLQLSAMYFFPLQKSLAMAASFGMLVAICYGFELYSLVTQKGHADNLDAIAGILGGVIGIALVRCFITMLYH